MQCSFGTWYIYIYTYVHGIGYTYAVQVWSDWMRPDAVQ